MPVDREIHLGYPNAEKAFEFAKRIGIDITDGEETVFDYAAYMNDTDPRSMYVFEPETRFDKQLRDSFISTLDELGWKTGEIVEPKIYADSNRYIGVHSPWGPRIAGFWGLWSCYDPVELGDEKSNFSIAVNLSSRYKPHIMDMDNPHGGLDNAVVFDKEFFDRIEVCKRNIINAIPEMHDAEVFIRNVFY